MFTEDKMMHVKKGSDTLALLPAEFVARAPLLDRKKIKPKYLKSIKKENKMEKNIRLFRDNSKITCQSKHNK